MAAKARATGLFFTAFNLFYFNKSVNINMAKHRFVYTMLSNVGKDATDIAVLRARLNALETDQLLEKTRFMIHASLMEDEIRALKEEVRALRREPVLLVDARGNPIDLNTCHIVRERAVFSNAKKAHGNIYA
jgi:hypothetical protein